MTKEHRMRELKLLSSEKYTVIQWTFLHPMDKLLFYQRMALNDRPDDVTTSDGETGSLNNTRSNINEHEDDAPRGLPAHPPWIRQRHKPQRHCAGA